VTLAALTRAGIIRAVLLLLGAIAVPLTLLWDYSWESTIGIDRPWNPPHTANYLAVLLAALGALRVVAQVTRSGVGGVPLGRARAPLGAWLALWGALAFVAALLFDRWWQASYGLAAGIWHPPQLAKGLAYFAVVIGAWLALLARQRDTRSALAAACAAGGVLALIWVVTTPQSFANRQHSAVFYELGCAAYPVVLAAHALAGRLRAPASAAALAYLGLAASLVWLLPLFPATPQAGPVYNALTHMLPPPFPLLLVVPALALDALLARYSTSKARGGAWAAALQAGVAFFVLFLATQWWFSEFLLSPASDSWLFAGGGRHWPFFLRIDPSARTAFWDFVSPGLGPTSAALSAALAVVCARAGVWVGAALRPGEERA
jgi:hypothetical protein